MVEEERSSRAVGMRQQGAWTRWEQVVERKISWTDLWRAEPHCIKFLVQAVYDVPLPTCTAGDWPTHQHAPFAREKGP